MSFRLLIAGWRGRRVQYDTSAPIPIWCSFYWNNGQPFSLVGATVTWEFYETPDRSQTPFASVVLSTGPGHYASITPDFSALGLLPDTTYYLSSPVVRFGVQYLDPALTPFSHHP